MRNTGVEPMPEQSWIITTAVGTGEKGYAGDGGPAAQALLNGPFDVGFDPLGNLYFSDTYTGVSRWHPAQLDLREVGAGRKAVALIHPCHWDEGVVSKVRRFGRELGAGKWRG